MAPSFPDCNGPLLPRGTPPDALHKPLILAALGVFVWLGALFAQPHYLVATATGKTLHRDVHVLTRSTSAPTVIQSQLALQQISLRKVHTMRSFSEGSESTQWSHPSSFNLPILAALLVSGTALGSWLFSRSLFRHARQQTLEDPKQEMLMLSTTAASNDNKGIQQMARGPHVVIVGAGVSGLCTAGRLMQAGIQVTLVEQNEREACGGRLWTEYIGPFRFEVGASLLLCPNVYSETFDALGFDKPFEDVVGGLTKLVPAYGIFFDRPAWNPTSSSLTSTDPVPQQYPPNPRKVALGAVGGDPGWTALVERADAKSVVSSYSSHAQAMLDAGFPLFIDGDLGAATSSDAEEATAARASLAAGLKAAPAFAAAALQVGGNPFMSHATAVARRLPPIATSAGAPSSGDQRGTPSIATARRMVRAALTFQDLYVGLTPSTAPNVFGLLHAIELGTKDASTGIYYPKGGEGFGAVPKALAERVLTHPLLREASFRTKCITTLKKEGEEDRVSGILVERDGQRQELLADAVVITADRAVMAPLLEGGSDAERMATADYSSSSVTFLLGFDPSAADQIHSALEHHNVFLGEDVSVDMDDGGYYGAEGWGASLAVDGKPPKFPQLLPGSPGRFPFYLCCPSKTDPKAATNGGAALMVLVPVPNLSDRGAGSDGEAEAQLVKAARAGVVRALVEDAQAFASVADFEKHLQVERVISPSEWQARFGLRHGAVFGLSHGLNQLGPFRPRLRARTASNLFYCGASAQPGNGVPLVMVSAKKVARLVKEAVGQTSVSGR